MPAVSVITANYNRASVLPRAIESLHRQTFGDYEHIIVDDGSTDPSLEVVETHRDHRTRVIRFEENRGTATAWNRAIEAATGEYISFLDSDDLYHPRRLERTVKTMDSQGSEVGGVVHAIQNLTDHGTVCHRVPSGMIELDDLAATNVIRGTTNTMYRAAVFDEIGGFDEKLPASLDYDVQLRTAKHFSLFGIDEVLCSKDDTVSGMQDDPRRIRTGLKRILAKHGERLSDANVAERSFLIGVACLQLDDVERAHEWFDDALEHALPDDAMLHYRIGSAYLEADQVPDARVHLRESLREDATDYRRHALFWLSFLPTSGATTVDTLRRLRERLFPNRRQAGLE